MKLILLALAFQNIAPTPQPHFADIARMPVPVIAGDITDHPYRVVGELQVNVAKMTIFSADPSEQRVYRELWERAQRLGADAVVNAHYSESVPGGWTWGRRKAYGQAIKFLSDAEVAQRQGWTSAIATANVPQQMAQSSMKVRAATASGYCLKVPTNYIGTGAINSPIVTSALPRCDTLRR